VLAQQQEPLSGEAMTTCLTRLPGTLLPLFLALVVAAVALASPAQAGKRDDTLIVALSASLITLDRLYSTQREGLILTQLTDDGLFMVDPESLDFVPLAAQSHTWIDDTTLEVTLRQGIRFHDGSVLTADDVVYTYEWMLNPASQTARGPAVRRWLAAVERLDDHRVRFHLHMPYPMAVRDMAISVPLRRLGTYDQGNNVTELNGIGPYRVTGFSAGREIALERFEDYHRSSPKGQPAIGRIRFRIIPDQGTQQAEFLSGGVHIMLDVPTDTARNVRVLPGVKHLFGDDMRIAYITLDAAGYTGGDHPFTNVLVRRAMNHAINRREIVDYLISGSAEVIDHACHPLQFGCVGDVAAYAYDPDKARALLAEAGYADGFAFDLWAYREKIVAEAIVGNLREVGINARLRYVKLSVFSKARSERAMPAFFASYGSGGTADASASAGVHFEHGSNRNYSADAAVSEALYAAETTNDPKRRLELYEQALTRIADQAYWVPMFTYSQNYLVTEALDFPVPRDGLPRFWQARWK